MIHAIVMIDVAADSIPETAQEIANLEFVDQVYSCAGDVDLIAVLRVVDYELIADIVTGGINKVAGVLGTHTHIAFRAYNSADVEAGFSLGINE